MSSLRVTKIQSSLYWEDEQANLQMFDEKLTGLLGGTDLVVLPEMFNSGFSMHPENFAQAKLGSTVLWMQEKAKALNAAVCGSLAIKTPAGFYNQFVFAHPDGKIDRYNKRHCFRMSGEHLVYQSGNERLVINYRGWRILPQVCYDLRFPAFSRSKNDVDLMIYVANWPQVRREPWRCLLQARAIENLSFVVGVNRIGQDANNVAYSGDSLSIDFKGNILFDSEGKDSCDTQVLSLTQLQEFRDKFPAWRDSDQFEIEI